MINSQPAVAYVVQCRCRYFIDACLYSTACRLGPMPFRCTPRAQSQCRCTDADRWCYQSCNSNSDSTQILAYNKPAYLSGRKWHAGTFEATDAKSQTPPPKSHSPPSPALHFFPFSLLHSYPPNPARGSGGALYATPVDSGAEQTHLVAAYFNSPPNISMTQNASFPLGLDAPGKWQAYGLRSDKNHPVAFN